ncbi:MAG: tRNA pseudouridine(38-40) synthase TruA [Deltaproteobacteria bacterium]|nr:tRNA pseudouridine(38-40) synthase TruA [Deltaproteobacteria bacterium]
MRNLKLTIEYDGTNYSGWQSQTNAPTIQDTLESAFARILSHRVGLIGAGRTDSGVHALGQVANFKTASSLELSSLLRGANSLLPNDIMIRKIEEVDAIFHARFSAKSRIYEYHIWDNPLPSVFHRNYTWWIRDGLDASLMGKAVLHLLGHHDFSSFQGADKEEVFSEREVMTAAFERRGPKLVFSIEANAFLRHMVRNIIGTLIEVGKGKISPKNFFEIFAARDRRKAGITAPGCGLFLKHVRY